MWLSSGVIVVSRDLVTGRDFRLPVGNRISRAPPGFGYTGRKIPKILNFNKNPRKWLK